MLSRSQRHEQSGHDQGELGGDAGGDIALQAGSLGEKQDGSNHSTLTCGGGVCTVGTC